MPAGTIAKADIQAASSLEGIQQLFARLGYDVSEPLPQTATSLGIAERVSHMIRDIRRIAAQKAGPGLAPALEVYWLEATSLTADLRKAIASAFRDMPARVLLVMSTRDFDPLDLVLVEKATQQGPIGGSRVAVSHRLFSLDRRNPSDKHLSVMERMRYRAADPYAQFDRIRDAFTFAEWATDEFNNRNLFSDYFLKHRLPLRELFPVWHEDFKPAQRAFEGIFQAVVEPANLAPADYESRLVKPILAALGFTTERVKGEDAEVDCLLRPRGAASDTPPCAGLLVYPWDRPLDRKDDRDRDRAEDVPGIRVVKAMEHHQLGWAILTNGKDWRLYCAKAHSRASNYYEVDLPATLERDDLIAFRYFYLFFRAQAFVGAGEALCFLDRLRQGSAAFAKELGDRLRGHIFGDVFPYLAQGFVDYRKARFDETTTAGDPFLDEVYDATLTLLYRLLFLLYAESLDLLPVHEPAYSGVSLTRIKEEIAEAAGRDHDAVEKRLKDRHNRTDTGLYKRLADLFKTIDEGNKERNVPGYNGGLFETAPEARDRSRESAAARFLKKYRVPDFYLARAIDLLARAEDDKTHELVFVDYKALGVRQLGNVYEGLLMYHVVLPRDDWEKGFRRPGLKVALVPSNKKRKSTGSYFTPQHIVKYIVTHTVGPLLTEKFEAIAPKLRAAKREYAETCAFERKRAEKLGRSAPRTDDDIAHNIEKKYADTVWDLFDLKVLDPAMGSGHFLVETVDFITDKVLDFLAGFPWNPVQVLIEHRVRRPIIESLDAQGVKINEDRLTDVNLIKRLVMKRCVYGVDLNPMAVELAKVSLWLDSFTLGAPLSFLDHHLKCGNSLIGATIEQLKKVVADSGSLFAIPMEPLDRATRDMEQIADLTDATLTEVTTSSETYTKVLANVKGYRVLLDCLTSQHFGQSKAADIVVHAESLGLKLDDWDRSLPKVPEVMGRIIRESLRISTERRFFHWDLDFPDVFFTARRELGRRAFDAVLGNPPYVFIVEVAGEERDYFAKRWSTVEYRFDIYGVFIELATSIMRPGARSGFIVPHSLLNNNSFSALRSCLLARCDELQLFDFTVPIFEEASNEPMLIFAQSRLSKSSKETSLLGARTSDSTLSPHILRTLPHKMFSKLPGEPFVIPEDPDVSLVLQKCAATAHCFDEYVEATQGLRTGDNKRFLRPRPLTRGDWRPAIGGEHVGRYDIEPINLYVQYDRDALDAPRDERFWIADHKIVVQEVRNVHLLRRVAATLDRHKRIALNTTNAIVLRPGSPYNLCTLLAVMNSSVTSEFMRACYRDNHIATQYIYSIPCPDLHRACDGLNLIVGRDTTYKGDSSSVLSKLVLDLSDLMERRVSIVTDLHAAVKSATEVEHLSDWEGYARFPELDYLGWQGRYPSWCPDDKAATDNRWFPNGVAPPIPGNGPGEIPWDLIARVYPSYPLPGIDEKAWEAAAWEALCELLRKNKGKIGNARIRADLVGRGAVTSPTGPMRKLQETFLKYHREVRENRARAAEIDLLIDRIVFRLFELTLDEQKLILSRVGPGRPLPPRRGRGRKRAAGRPSEESPSLFGESQE